MPFKKGNKHWKRRKKESPGRPRREEAAAKESAQQKALRLIEAGAEKVVKKYLVFARSNAATARHYMDKLLPDEYEIDTPKEATLTITVKRRVQESADRDRAELRPHGKRRSVRVSGRKRRGR